MKVAAYCRVSTDKDDQVNSLHSQMIYFNTHIQNHEDWDLAKVYADEGVTGTSTKKRTEFNNMIQSARRGEIDLIITKEVSRFARNTLDTLKYTRELKECGVGVYFIIDNINTLSNEGEFRLTIMASVAQEESRKTSERVKWGQKRRMEQGVVFGNNSIYGYELKNGKLEINEAEAEVVKYIFDSYVYGKLGSYTIVKELNNKLVKPRYSKEWSAPTIVKILKNEKYVGDLKQKKHITKNYLNHKKIINDGSEDVVILKDHHPAIIDRAVWESAQTILTSRNKQYKSDVTDYNIKYWFSGKVVCGLCGSKAKTRNTYNESRTIRSVECFNKTKHGKRHQLDNDRWVGCNSSRVSEEILLSCLDTVFDNIVINYDAIKEEVVNEIKSMCTQAEQGNARNRIEKANQKIKALTDKKMKLLTFLLDEVISKDEFEIKKSSIDLEINDLNEEIGNLNSQLAYSDNGEELMNSICKDIDNLFNKIKDGQRAYENIVEKITLLNRSVHIELKNFPLVYGVSYSIKRTDLKYSYQIDDCWVVE